MVSFIIRRLFQAVAILIIVSLLVFFAIRILPGDPILLLVTSNQKAEFTEQQIETLRHEYGLDRPIIVQCVDWMGGVLRGDLGNSIINKIAVGPEIIKRFRISIHLGLLSFIIGNVIGIPMGIIAAIRRAKWIDSVVTVLSNIGITVPNFWFGMILIYVFGLYFRLLPTMGYTSPTTDFWLNTKQIIMPLACLSLFPIAGTARQARSSLLEVMHQDYIRTAWSKGLRERVVVFRHALKNGIIPVVTLSGMQLSMIIGGQVLIEMVFNIPGMGRLLVTSVNNQDYPYVQGIILLIAAVVVFVNLLVDLTYGWLDPRIRYN
jgi:peptide/nickel transport system permease protein